MYMLYLALAVGCSLTIGMIFKYAGERGMNRVALLTVNYLVAFAVGAVLVAREAGAAAGATAGLWALGIFTGALFILGFFLFALATAEAGMGLAIGVMRVSVVVPFAASWLVWGEAPGPWQLVGMVLAGAAFFMIARTGRSVEAVHEGAPVDADDTPYAPDPEHHALRAFLLLGSLFLCGGLVDVTMKTFDEVFAATSSRAFFLLLIFGVAFLIGLAFVLRRGLVEGEWPRRDTLVWGFVLGVVNYLSVEFLLGAVERLPGTIVFPANSIAIVILGALLGVFVWRERLTRLNWTGIGVAAAALVLLNV